MKALKMLAPFAALFAAGAPGAGAAPSEKPQVAARPVPTSVLWQKAPFLSVAAKATAGKLYVSSDDVFTNGLRTTHKGDLILVSTPRQPVRLDSPEVQVRASMVILSKRNRSVQASGGDPYGSQSGGPNVQIKTSLTTRKSRAAVRVEAECKAATISQGQVQLREIVSGFYEDAAGRHPLAGKDVTLSAFDNAVSIVQDGDITLSAAP